MYDSNLLTPSSASPHEIHSPMAAALPPSHHSLGLPSHNTSNYCSLSLPNSNFGTPLSLSTLTTDPSIALALYSSFDGNSLLEDEKKKKRRESHNMVERKDNINERIGELATLLPDIVTDLNAGHPKPHKGLVLRRSVDYIKHVQGLLKKQNERIEELENVIRSLASLMNMTEESLQLSCPLGTRIANTDILIPSLEKSLSANSSASTSPYPPTLDHPSASHSVALSLGHTPQIQQSSHGGPRMISCMENVLPRANFPVKMDME